MMDEQCIFCKIVNGKAPAAIVYEDEKHLAFLDINQSVAGKTLLIPKTHYTDIRALPAEALGPLFQLAQKLILHYQTLGLANDFQLFNTCGALAQQTVFHLHLHIIPRNVADGADLRMPFNPKTADEMAQLASKLRLSAE